MERIIVDSYKLNKISSTMAKIYGTIPKGHEELFAIPLSSMEGNLLKLHRQNTNRTSWHALTAIQMSLLTIDGYLRTVQYDFNHFVTPETQDFLHGLLMSFDPYTNPEIHNVLMEKESSFVAQQYFVTPVKCLLRIEKSVKLWTKEYGPSGYFDFIERHMGYIISQDDQMTFSITIDEGK